MPRTIEKIVDSHRRARERRQAGKPSWERTIDIKSIINESDDEGIERTCDVATRIAAKLRSALPASTFDVTNADFDWNFDELVDDLESYTVEGMRSLEEEGVDVLEMFNGRLDEIYDWADRERVWLG